MYVKRKKERRKKNWNIQNSIKFDEHDNNLLIDTSFRCKMIFLGIKRIKRRWRENISTWNDYQIHKSIIDRIYKLLSEVSNEY